MTDTRTATTRRSAASPPGSSRGRPDRAAAGSWPVRERSLIKAVLGVPPWTAVLLAVVMTAVGVGVDLFRVGTVGAVFEIAYGVGCVVAVAWVRRRSLFLPAIQPPLLLAVVVPLLAVLIGAPSESAGLTEHLLLAGAPLINAFPAMAVTTVLVLLVAGFRLVRQRTGPDDAVGLLRARLSGRGAGRSDDGRGPDDARATDRAAADRTAADRAPGRTRGRGDRGGDRAASRGSDRGSDRPATRATGRPAARTADRAAADAPERSGRPARRRSPAASADTRDRAGSTSRSGDDRTGRGRAGGPRSSRSDGAAEPTRGDDRSSNPGRGSSGTGRAGTGRPARRPGSGPSSASSGRTRRPRPSDPT